MLFSYPWERQTVDYSQEGLAGNFVTSHGYQKLRVGFQRLLLELCQGVKVSVWPQDRQVGCRSMSCTPASMPTCSCPSIAPFLSPQPRAWCDTLSRHLHAQLCCQRGLVASTRIPFAGQSQRSRVVPAGVRQGHSSAFRAPQRMDRLSWYSWLAEARDLRQHSGSRMGRGQQGCQWAANTKCLQRSVAAYVRSAVLQAACGHWLDIRQAAESLIIGSHPNV